MSDYLPTASKGILQSGTVFLFVVKMMVNRLTARIFKLNGKNVIAFL